MNYLDRADEAYEERRDEPWTTMSVVPLDKYKANLRVVEELVNGGIYVHVYSYETHVACGLRGGGKLVQSQWYSMTTSKHINYAAKELNMKVVKLF